MNKELQARDLAQLSERTGNCFKSVSLIARLAEQIRKERRIAFLGEIEEMGLIGGLHQRIEGDDEVQALLSKRFEVMPKPILQATEEFLHGRVIVEQKQMIA